MFKRDEAKIQALREEMQSNARANAKKQRVMWIILILVMVGSFHFMGSCAKGSIMDTRTSDAVDEFTKGLKLMGQMTPDKSFQPANYAFDQLEKETKRFETPMYKGAMLVLTYDFHRSRNEPVDDKQLSEGEKLLKEAIRRNSKRPDPYFYLAGIAHAQKDKTRCMSELQNCIQAAEKSDPIYKTSWLEKANSVKAEMEKDFEGTFSMFPPKAMTPKIELIKV